MIIEHQYVVVTTDGKPLYYFLDGRHFKGCFNTSDTEYDIIKDEDVEELYWVRELNKGSIHRYSEEEIKTLLGVEIK
jgi:hypothetical protein